MTGLQNRVHLLKSLLEATKTKQHTHSQSNAKKGGGGGKSKSGAAGESSDDGLAQTKFTLRVDTLNRRLRKKLQQLEDAKKQVEQVKKTMLVDGS